MKTSWDGKDKHDHQRAAEAQAEEPAGRRDDRPLSLRVASGRRSAKRASQGAGAGALIRCLMKQTFLKSRPAIEAALRRRFSDPATVQDCLELLARLEGELL